MVHCHGKHTARNPFFFNQTCTFSIPENTNPYILVSWLLVLNGMPDLIKTNLFFFSFLYSDSICLYTSWKHSFLWDNNTKCLVKLKWMLIKLNVLTLHRGKKYILCCESYPFLHKSFFFSIQKINIFFIRNCKWELKLWRNMNIWKHTRLLFKASFKGKLMNRFLQKA